MRTEEFPERAQFEFWIDVIDCDDQTHCATLNVTDWRNSGLDVHALSAVSCAGTTVVCSIAAIIK